MPTNKLYKRENTRQLKNFPAGYVGSFYRNLADNVDNTSDFYSTITADADIPREDVQKYILATSDFAKSIQMDINHYVTRDRINDASFRQRLDPISKNILRRQNPLELVFQDISTFDAENPIVGSLLRETDVKKISQIAILLYRCQAIQIKKRLDRLRGINTSFSNNNSNNNNNNNNNSNLFGPTPGGEPPSLPTIEDFLDGGPRPPQPPPPPPASTPFNLFGSNAPVFPPPTNDFNVNASVRAPPPNISTRGIGNYLFGSQAASAIREKKTKTQQEVDDFLYELPETMPDLVLGDELTSALGTAQNIFDQNASPTKKEEEDEILKLKMKVIEDAIKDFMEEYEIEKIRDTMDETAQVPESFFFLW